MKVRSAPGFRPRRVLAVDLATGELEYPDPSRIPGHDEAHVLVRWMGDPVGLVDVTASDDEIVSVVATAAGRELADEMARVGERTHPGTGALPDTDGTSRAPLPAMSAGPLVTVAIASYRNVDSTLACVRRVLQNSWAALEVVVVDNAPDPGELGAALDAAFAPEPRVRRVHEPRQGLSFARNAGLAAARGSVVAFTDDDVRVDRRWVERLVAGFGSDAVACVTGAILPAELETQPQVWLEEFGGFHRGFRQEIFNSTTHRRDGPLYPYNAGMFGSGANMAFRTTVLRDMGGFAVDLGTGTPAQGGEDLDIFQRTITGGHTLVYQPTALMWHYHRRSVRALRRQMFRYGVGLSATVTKWMFDSPRTAAAILRRIPLGLGYLLSPTSKKNHGKSHTYPRVLTLLELAGVAVGPLAYLLSRRYVRRLTLGEGDLPLGESLSRT